MPDPRWIFVTGRHRCHRCGEVCLAAWLCYTSPSVWTLAYCEPCAAAVTTTPKGT
jgi:hypothetical protein